MTPIDLAAIKAKAEAATPGPWFQTILPWFCANDGVLAGSADGNIGYLIVDCDTSFSCGKRGDYEGPFKLSSPEADAAYIAAMDPPTALAMIARIEAAEAGARRMHDLAMGAEQENTKSRAERDAAIERAEKAEAEIEAGDGLITHLSGALKDAIEELNSMCEEIDGEGFNNPKWNAILSAASAAREAPHLGWLYFNEDAGTEWSESHPVESGEVPDATDIRPATLDALKAELLSTWKDAAEDNAALIAAHAARAPATLPMDVSETALQVKRLRDVLCDPEDKCCIDGSDEDRRIVDEALSLLEAIDGRAHEPEWQPIESAPKDGTRILCTGGGCDGVQIAEYMTTIGAWGTETAILDDCDDDPDGYGRPTHWQHLPAASVEFCPICGGDCSAANPPVMNCPNNLPSAPAGGKDR